MKLWVSVAAMATLVTSLLGCGGGGGGGAGGFPVATPAPAPVTTTVSINGSPASADGNGQYTVKPGDTVEITPSQGAEWTTSGGGTTAVTLRSSNISSTKWSAQIVNAKPVAATYTVTAKASSNAGLTKDTVLNVAAGDARNGEYRVYSTIGLQFKLGLDFNVNSYAMTSGDGASVTGDFAAEVSEPGTYLFKSTRITAPVNVARFRVVPDTVVGNFPFADPFITPVTYVPQPFIAVRKLVTTQTELAGVYNRLGVQRTAAAAASSILQMQVLADGTAAVMCRNAAIRDMVNCPVVDRLNFSVTPSDTEGVWNIVNIADPNDGGRFVIAKIGDQSVYLSAGKIIATPDTLVWRLGVTDAPDWQAAKAYGGSTTGSWGSVAINPTDYTRTVLRPDGSTGTATSLVFTMGATRPAGMRQIDLSGQTYFGVRNTKLFVVVGASNASTGGYVLLNTLE